MALEVVGDCSKRVFGLTPAQRIARQLRPDRLPREIERAEPLGLAVDASAILDDAALVWLSENRGSVLRSPGGLPLAVARGIDELAEARLALVAAVPVAGAEPEQLFLRKVRRRVELIALSVDETPVVAIERRLYGNSYKGVTDLVTKYVWPVPAFHATRWCAAVGITPNMVTAVGLGLTFLAGWFFYQGQFGAGLAAAWAMTFLDTLDGKLARVTGQSSMVGNILDHGNDIIHPPLWWWAVTVGAARLDPRLEETLWLCLWVILATYVVSRVIETAFKLRFGFNPYVWQAFDSRFRLIISRRNVILLMLTVGVVAGMLSESWIVVAGWSIVSVVVQLVRYCEAEAAARRGPLQPFLA